MASPDVGVDTSSSNLKGDSSSLVHELPREDLAWMLQKICETRYFEERMVLRALEAAEQLTAEGLEIKAEDPHTLKYLDAETILYSVSKTGRAFIVHEAPVTGGFVGELSALIAKNETFDFLDAPVHHLSGRNIPIPYKWALERALVPQVKGILVADSALALEGR